MVREEGTDSLLVTVVALKAGVGFGRRQLPVLRHRLVFSYGRVSVTRELSLGREGGFAQAERLPKRPRPRSPRCRCAWHSSRKLGVAAADSELGAARWAAALLG